MKKLIKSIIAFFFPAQVKPYEECITIEEHDFNSFEEERESLEFEKMKSGSKYYRVDHKLYGMISMEKNLLAVSRQYPDLKKSTLYDAFKDERNLSRTYEKYNLKVTECQKS